MLGVNSSGIFGQKPKQIVLEQKPSVNEIELLKKTVNEMREIIQSQESTASAHRKEIVELISSISRNCESAVSQKIEETLKTHQPLPIVTHDQSVPRLQVESQPKNKPKKKKFAPICDSIYNDAVSARPDIACVDKASLYIGEDNNIYHKSGIKYNLIDALYLCKLAGKNK